MNLYGYASIHIEVKICLFQYHIAEYLAHTLVKWIHDDGDGVCLIIGEEIKDGF